MEILEHTESATIRGDGLSGSGGNGKSIGNRLTGPLRRKTARFSLFENPDNVSAFTHECRLWRKVHRTDGECAEFIVHIRRQPPTSPTQTASTR